MQQWRLGQLSEKELKEQEQELAKQLEDGSITFEDAMELDSIRRRLKAIQQVRFDK